MEMSRLTGLPPSPVLSGRSTQASSFDFSQCSDTEGLVAGVPCEEVTRLIDQYNRRSVPIMDDDVFRKQLAQLAVRPLKSLEEDVKSWVKNEDDRLGQDCEAAKVQMSLLASKFFLDSEQLFHFVAGLKYTESIQGWRRLLSYALPSLLAAAVQQLSSAPRGRKRRNEEGLVPASNATVNQSVRRSARLGKRKRLT